MMFGKFMHFRKSITLWEWSLQFVCICACVCR